MKIAYIDLGYSNEEYGLYPTKYGGGGVAARFLKEEKDIDFRIFASATSFLNLRINDRHDRCISIPESIQIALRKGYPISEIVGLNIHSFDLILHPHTCMTINRGSYRGPIVHFCGFDGAAGCRGNDYILFYDDSFISKFGEKVKYVRIGKPVPSIFRCHPKAPYVFQCSRHDDHMNSIQIAKDCIRFSIHGYFAGPIHNQYPLLEYINNKTTYYLGEIDESVKLGYYRHAKLCTLLANWDVPFNQSIIEAQGEGTPIYVNNRGPFFAKYLRHGINGFDAAKINLLEAFNLSEQISQKTCWEAAREYDVSVMVASFKKAFYEILDEWRNKT